MVAFDAVRASNSKIHDLPPGLVALFVGGTSGIGEGTVKQLSRYAFKPKIYIVGRNVEAGNRIISEMKKIQAEGEYSFIQKDVSLLKNVDEVCNEIKSKEGKVNLLFMTQGTLSLQGRNDTSEGIDKRMSANYYSRLRFVDQLLPQLKAASPQLSRVVSVLAPGSESDSIDFTDLGLKKSFSIGKALRHCVVMKDFAFEELAKTNPTVSFVHAYPGFVKTGYFKEQNAFVRAGGSLLMTALTPWAFTIDQSGEKHLFAATSEKYPPKDGPQGGVASGGESILKGTDGKTGTGAYLVGVSGEFQGKEKVLQKLREAGAGEKVWQHTREEFGRVESA